MERVPEGYVERHHIIPKCMGGSDDRSNLVALTPEEHFLCHVLLVKIYPEHSGLIYAVNMMCRKVQGRPKRKLYGWLRRKFSETLSADMKIRSKGDGNSQFGTFWISKVETGENRKIPLGDPIPEGWNRGRFLEWRQKTIKPCKVCGCGFSGQKTVCSHECNSLVRSQKFKNDFYEDTKNHLLNFIQSDYDSLNKYVEKEYDFSLVTFTKRMKKFFPSLGDNQGCRSMKEKIKEVLLYC